MAESETRMVQWVPAQREVEIFLEFAQAAALPVDSGSVQAQEPPLPDISCDIGGERWSYELARATDLAGLPMESRRTTFDGEVDGLEVYDLRRILRAAVARKAARAHQAASCHVGLLVYYEATSYGVSHVDYVEPTFRDLQALYKDRWAGMWLYHRNQRRVFKPTAH